MRFVLRPQHGLDCIAIYRSNVNKQFASEYLNLSMNIDAQY